MSSSEINENKRRKAPYRFFYTPTILLDQIYVPSNDRTPTKVDFMATNKTRIRVIKRNRTKTTTAATESESTIPTTLTDTRTTSSAPKMRKIVRRFKTTTTTTTTTTTGQPPTTVITMEPSTISAKNRNLFNLRLRKNITLVAANATANEIKEIDTNIISDSTDGNLSTRTEKLLEVNRITQVSLKEGTNDTTLGTRIENDTISNLMDKIGQVSRVTVIKVIDGSASNHSKSHVEDNSVIYNHYLPSNISRLSRKHNENRYYRVFVPSDSSIRQQESQPFLKPSMSMSMTLTNDEPVDQLNSLIDNFFSTNQVTIQMNKELISKNLTKMNAVAATENEVLTLPLQQLFNITTTEPTIKIRILSENSTVLHTDDAQQNSTSNEFKTNLQNGGVRTVDLRVLQV